MSHGLTTTHETVQHLHQLARIEAVALAQIDKQPLVALLCLVLQFLFVRLRFLLLSHIHLFYLRRLRIVSQELTKLQRDNLLDDLLLVDILEVAADVLHEGGNLLIVHIRLHNLVHHLIKLLFADFLCRRYLRLHKGLADLFLYIADLELLLAVNDRDTCAFLACTTSTTASVRIVLDVIRQSEVDHMRQIVHIETSCCHIRCHQQLRQVLTELLHRQVTLWLREVAMQRLSVIAVTDQFVGYLLRLDLRATEDDGKDLGIIVHDSFQRQILVLRTHQIIDVVHVLCALVAATDNNLLIVVQVFLCHLFHLPAHRRREHQRTVVLVDRLKYLADILRESHIQHLIGLIEYDITNTCQVCNTPILKVYESSWSSHDDVHTLLQGSHLRFYRSSAIDGLHMHAFHILRKVTDVIRDLQTQLSCRTQHQGLRLSARGINPFQQWDTECRRLARSRLGKRYHVVLVLQEIRYHSLLHRHRLHKPQLFDGLADLSTHA